MIINVLELSTRDLWVERHHAENFDLTWDKVNDQLERIHTSQVRTYHQCPNHPI